MNPLRGNTLFEPKVYKKNGLEAFRLVGSDGSEFFYEGAIDCNEKEIFKDEQGRLYYPVLTEIGGAVRYYVELDLDFPTIPANDPAYEEKEISRLVNASPRSGRQLPEDVFVPRTEEKVVAEEPALEEPAQEVPAPEVLVQEVPVQEEPTSKEPASEEPAPEEPAPPAITEPEPSQEPVAPEVKASPAEPVVSAQEKSPEAEPLARKPRKTRPMTVPLAIGLILVILIAAIAGAYVLKPEAFDGLTSLYAPTPVPQPTPLPTAEPEVTATPEPAPEPVSEPQNVATEALRIQPLINIDSPAVSAFAAEHIAANSGANKIRQAYDLYTFVNTRWNYTDDLTSQGLPASTLTQALGGNSRDYSVLMCSLTTSVGLESRIIAYYKNNQLYYYPEILVANTSDDYEAVKADLKTWFGVTQAYGHSDARGYWISLSRGTAPGTRVEAAEEFAIYISGPPVKIK
ncbi:transglutaminase domain-containing protein [Methanocella arvoryzae]|uniref:Transglutaminase-like domain-containing protein n=1 Tax=Methanocella arvoryzae (strain DSM 22066 / NBRC 105507 / MRE50) TaxID=351160 RepID=Q0W7T0_METAR|nr:transglutaminase domain-containing protein [Methanocella arvoryzae]CAJ35563.1 hypothetical protein RCIX49 [Methanocella arvoryzae MRE50]